MNGGKKAAGYPHSESEDNPPKKQVGRDLERKSQMRESLPVHRSRGKTIEWQNGGTAERASHEGNEHGFNQEGEHHGEGAETESPHGGDFAAALGDRGIHGVESEIG